MGKIIDSNRLTRFWGKVKDYLASNYIDAGSIEHFVITEDMFDIAFDDTKGVAPYSASYGYTDITIHADAGVEWKEGAIYNFVLDEKVSTSANRNVRVRIGEGDWKPLMGTTAIASGYTIFIKSSVNIFLYKSTYQAEGALHCLYDTNSTYTINYLIDAAVVKSGVGAYAVTRYVLCMQKPDMTWEKIVDTASNYSTGTAKKVNKRGFLLDRIRYYYATANCANGATIAANVLQAQSANVDARYSTNCGTPASWVAGDYFYLVGRIGEDGLFYLDETTWWSVALPTQEDGKLYIQIGRVITSASYSISFYVNHPIYYFKDGVIKEYRIADNKQDVIEDLGDIRRGAERGATALQNHQDISGKQDLITPTNKLPYSLVSGTPAEVNESKVAEWGFTKNSGTYSKPSSGIPKTDLASTVQASLNKADSALQEHQDISGKADLMSPAFTGTPTAPTAASSTSTRQLATTQFVQQEIDRRANAFAFTIGQGNIVLTTVESITTIL